MSEKIEDSYTEFTSRLVGYQQQSARSLQDNLELYRGIGKVIIHKPVDDMIAVGRSIKDESLEFKKNKIVKKALSQYRLYGESALIGDNNVVKVVREADINREINESGEYDRVLYNSIDIKEYSFSLLLIRESLEFDSMLSVSYKRGVGVLQECKEALLYYLASLEYANQILKTKSIDILSVEGLDEAITTTTGQQQAVKRIEAIAQIRSVFGTMLLDKNTEFKTVEKNVSGVDKIVEEHKVHLCSVAKIPMSILFGKTSTGLAYAGKTEHENYSSLLREYQLIAKPIYNYLDEIWGDKGKFNRVKRGAEKETEDANKIVVDYLISLMESDIIDDKQAMSVLEKKGIL